MTENTAAAASDFSEFDIETETDSAALETVEGVTETAETAETAETEAKPAKVKPAIKPIDYDLSAVSDDSPAEVKILASVIAPYNKTVEAIRAFNAFGNIEDKAAEVIEEAEEGSDVARLTAAIAQLEEKLKQAKEKRKELAKAIAIEAIDPDFDELSARAAVKDNRNEAIANFKNAQDIFALLGHVEISKDAVGRIESVDALTEYGETLLLAANVPNLRKEKGSANPAGESITSKIREWAKAQGKDVSERGRISQEIQDEYAAAHALETTEA